MQLSDLKIRPSKNRKRVGRGNGSQGTYSGRGVKGQKARTGGNIKAGFEGGQTPIIRRMPKLRGFRNFNMIKYQIVNLESINKLFDDNSTVNKKALFEKKLISKLKQPVKILGSGKIDKKFEIHCENISKSALEKLEKAKGRFQSVATKGSVAPKAKSSTKVEKQQKVETQKKDVEQKSKAEKTVKKTKK